MTSLPTPRIGQVIRYSFQFSNGDEKERPAVIIVAIQSQENNLYEVAVMPRACHQFKDMTEAAR